MHTSILCTNVHLVSAHTLDKLQRLLGVLARRPHAATHVTQWSLLAEADARELLDQAKGANNRGKNDEEQMFIKGRSNEKEC